MESANSTNDGGNATHPDYSIDFLIKLIPESFDGDRYKLRSFVKQIDAVFELANDNIKPALLLFVKSKIKGKAREQIDIHCNLTTWQGISDLLISLYQDKKSLDQLLEELSNTKQSMNESVSQFYQRLEDVNSRILAIIHSTENDATNLNGRILMINDVTLNRFIYHTHPQISQMLRYREFNNINSALTAAIAEEKVIRANPRNFSRQVQSNFAKNYVLHQPSNSRNTHTVHFNQQNTNKSPIKKCRYCNNLGHEIHECRKRMYNNSKRVNTQQSNSNNNSRHNETVNFQLANTQEHPPDESNELTEQFTDLHW